MANSNENVDARIVFGAEISKKDIDNAVKDAEQEAVKACAKIKPVKLSIKASTQFEAKNSAGKNEQNKIKKLNEAQSKLIAHWNKQFEKGFKSSPEFEHQTENLYKSYKDLAKGRHNASQYKEITSVIGKSISDFHKETDVQLTKVLGLTQKNINDALAKWEKTYQDNLKAKGEKRANELADKRFIADLAKGASRAKASTPGGPTRLGPRGATFNDTYFVPSEEEGKPPEILELNDKVGTYFGKNSLMKQYGANQKKYYNKFPVYAYNKKNHYNPEAIDETEKRAEKKRNNIAYSMENAKIFATTLFHDIAKIQGGLLHGREDTDFSDMIDQIAAVWVNAKTKNEDLTKTINTITTMLMNRFKDSGIIGITDGSTKGVVTSEKHTKQIQQQIMDAINNLVEIESVKLQEILALKSEAVKESLQRTRLLKKTTYGRTKKDLKNSSDVKMFAGMLKNSLQTDASSSIESAKEKLKKVVTTEKNDKSNKNIEKQLEKSAIQDKMDNAREAVLDDKQIQITEEDARSGFNTDANSEELINKVENLNKDNESSNIKDSIEESFQGNTITPLQSILEHIDGNISKIVDRFEKQPQKEKPPKKPASGGESMALSTWVVDPATGLFYQDTPHDAEPGTAIGPKLNYFRDNTDYDALQKQQFEKQLKDEEIDAITKHALQQEESAIQSELRKIFSSDFEAVFDPLYASIQKNMFKTQTGGTLKNVLGFMTGGLGYAFMPSLEKSRGQAETANIIAEDMKNAFDAAELSEDTDAMERIQEDAQKFAEAMKEAGGNIEKVAQYFRFISPELQKDNKYLQNISKGLNRNGGVLKQQTRYGEVLSYTFQLMARYIGQSIKRLLLMINPINLIKRAFSDFTGYNTKWQRTMNVIKYNLRAVIRPIMEKIAQIIVNIIGLLQSLASGLFGKKIDLFDQAAADSEKIHEELEAAANVSAGFDELHDIGSDNSGANDLMGDIYTPEWTGLQDIFENIGSAIHNIFDFIKGLNFWQWLAIGGAALLGFLALKTLINWFTKGKNPLQTIADGASFLEKAVGWSVLILSIAAFVAVLKDFIDVVGHMEPEEIAQAMIALGLSLAGLAVTFAGLLYIAKMFGASFLETLGVAAIVAALSLLVGAITLFVNAVKDIESEHLYDILTQLSEVMIIMAVIIGVLAVVAAKLGPTLAVAGVGILEISAAISIVILALAVLVKALDGSGDDIKMILDGISNVVHSVGNVIIGVITAVANTFVAAVNTIIAGAKVVGAIFGKDINAQYIPQINTQYIPKYEQGTNYVPNDGLAYLHQGEAVIPKKYNQLNDTGLTNEERTYMQQMMVTMKSLDGTMKQGIKVNGQFVQRGSDLVAVVNKTKSQTGADLISNVAYAR